jgi:hypothetical protein
VNPDTPLSVFPPRFAPIAGESRASASRCEPWVSLVIAAITTTKAERTAQEVGGERGLPPPLAVAPPMRAIHDIIGDELADAIPKRDALAVELGCTVHEEPSRREQQDGDPALDRASAELVVESVAFTCVGALGIPADGYSVPYLASWTEEADLAVLEQTAALIDRLASRIETAILE